MHDCFKLADTKKAVDGKQGHHLKKWKSNANQGIDLDRERPSKYHCHAADRAARGLAPKPKDATSSTTVAEKISTVAVSASPIKNKRMNHAKNDAMSNAVKE